MLAYIRGRIILKKTESAIIETNGIGYEIFFSAYTMSLLGPEGANVEAFLAESLSMYGGTTLYGFISAEEKRLFDLLRDSVPGTGAKKALEYLSKISKSIDDFYKAVSLQDAKTINAMFGFTAKTAEKLINALKDKLPERALPPQNKSLQNAYAQTLNALAALGFRPLESRNALEDIIAQAGPEAKTEDLLRMALKMLSPK